MRAASFCTPAVLVRRLSLTVALIALTWSGPARAATPGRPALDLLGPGAYGVRVIDYTAGTLPIRFWRGPSLSTGASDLEARLDGRLYLPSGPTSHATEPFPLVVIIPARHVTCQLADGTETVPQLGPANPAGICGDDPAAGTSRIHPERGYDYIGRALAARGVAVVAVDVSDLTALDHASADTGDSTGRLKIAFAHLDALRRWDNGGPAPAPIGGLLAGRLDFTRVGFIGHSRGGAAIGNVVRDNAQRAGFRYGVRAVLQIAAGGGIYAFGPDGGLIPSADDRFLRVTGVPLAGISGDCDGDGSNAGFATFARSKYAEPDDEAPKFYWRLAGANHAFFNQVFTVDDADQGYGAPGASFSAACSSVAPGTLRLARSDQQRLAQAYVSAFFRRFLLGETALDGFLAGTAPTPPELCPRISGRPCAEIVNTSYIPPASRRRLILEPDAVQPLTVSSHGGTIRAEGFDLFDWCEPSGRQPDGFSAPDYPKEVREPGRVNVVRFARRNCRTAAPGFDPAPASPAIENRFIQSPERQLELVWSRPASITVVLGPGAHDVSRFSALRLRAFADFLSQKSPQPDRARPVEAKAVKADFDIVLTDAHGRSARVRAGAFSDSALTVPFRPVPTANTSDNLIKLTLGGLRVPLSAFAHVDLTRLASARFEFGGPSAPTGALHLSDVLFDAGPPPTSGSSP